ncbi:MAG: HNH endonuclease [Anaerolineales bacterium]|nr:HNH endonuclease [Anaerolineales bacterium]MDW8325555.1 HNH endonuclease [Anaerolineales bacterium]
MPEPRITASQRSAVIERARGCCEYCCAQERYSPDTFSIEHIQPLSKQGTTQLDNPAFACQGCNSRKYTATEAQDPVTRQWVPLYHPRQHSWSKHFTWNEDCSLILGLTPTGRATVEKLQLNRIGLVNLRRILFALGEHPPLFE